MPKGMGYNNSKTTKGVKIPKKYPVTGKPVSDKALFGGSSDSIKGPATAGMKTKGSVEVGKGSQKQDF